MGEQMSGVVIQRVNKCPPPAKKSRMNKCPGEEMSEIKLSQLFNCVYPVKFDFKHLKVIGWILKYMYELWCIQP